MVYIPSFRHQGAEPAETGVAARAGVTLLELLVVMGVFGILVALLLPAVQQARDRAVQVACRNNLHQIGLALHQHDGTYGSLPPPPFAASPNTGLAISWMVMLLPFIDQTPLWQDTVAAFQADPNPRHNPPHIGFATVLPVYVCPSDGRLRSPQLDSDGEQAAFTSYVGVSGSLTGSWNGVLTGGMGEVRLTDITDGTSNTLMVGERPPSNLFDTGLWYLGNYGIYSNIVLPVQVGLTPQYFGCHPAPGSAFFVYGPGRMDNPCDRFHFWSLHPGGAHFLFADGSVHFLPYSVGSLLPALATRNGGEVVEASW
jgi:prepilin-type N-terminal cleavage/methylation domain-containing protein/prepilin-type processing-associated H-X9-DG protein